MRSSALEAIVTHEGRLDVLCCLVDGGPLAVPQLSTRTGSSLKAVRHYLKLLESFDLVKRTAGQGKGEPRYVATLEEHPDWVQDAVTERGSR